MWSYTAVFIVILEQETKMLVKLFVLCTVVCIALGRPSEPTLKDEKNLAELAESLGATQLVELLKIAKMDKLLETKGNVVV